jgi:hypothetical protein
LIQLLGVCLCTEKTKKARANRKLTKAIKQCKPKEILAAADFSKGAEAPETLKKREAVCSGVIK